MAGFREFSFINGTSRRIVVVLEPASSEYWIRHGAAVRIIVSSEESTPAFDLEFLPNGLVVYLARGASAVIYQDGKPLTEGCRAKNLGRRLNHTKSGRSEHKKVDTAASRGM